MTGEEETMETLAVTGPCPNCGYEGDWSGMHVTSNGWSCWVKPAAGKIEEPPVMDLPL